MSLHPSSVVEDGAVIGTGVEIGPFCHVGARAVSMAALPGLAEAMSARDHRRFGTAWRQGVFYVMVVGIPLLSGSTGYVVAQRKAAISSKASGRLEWLGVAEGSRVKTGDVIARLDARDVQAQLEAAAPWSDRHPAIWHD